MSTDKVNDAVFQLLTQNPNMWMSTAKLSDKDVVFLIDTGAQTNVMTMSIVKKLGIESFVDEKFKGKMHGVGTAKLLGIIPYIEINFGTQKDPIICGANFSILDDTDSEKTKPLDILLGFPFMMYYKVTLDFGKSKMTIMQNEINITIKEF